jgi:hypothetical protein
MSVVDGRVGVLAGSFLGHFSDFVNNNVRCMTRAKRYSSFDLTLRVNLLQL